MKILYHHRTTARDGSAVHINGLIEALRELGVEVHVVAPKIAASEVGDARKTSWVSSLRAGLPRFVHEIGELAYNIPEATALRRAVQEFRPDLIYQRSNLYLLSGAQVARQFGLPLIEEINAPYFHERSRHGGISLPPLANWAERRAWIRANEVIAVTGVLADMIAARGVPRERLHVMHNGIDRGLLTSTAVDPQAKARLSLSQYTVLGFTGFVRDWNGLDNVLDQLARPEGRDWFLLIVGDGPARPGLEQRARDIGVASRVQFTGVVKRPDVAGYVSAFDVALQPAANPYASPLKLFEYMALGRAIVAPNQPNIREVLTHEKDALLFEPDDPASFAHAVQRVAEDAELRARIASTAPVTVRQRQLTWRCNAQRVVDIAERLVALSGPQDKWVEQGARTRT